jgi:hypothetical protein
VQIEVNVGCLVDTTVARKCAITRPGAQVARGDPNPQRRRAAGEPQRRFQVHRLAVNPGVDRCRGMYL